MNAAGNDTNGAAAAAVGALLLVVGALMVRFKRRRRSFDTRMGLLPSRLRESAAYDRVVYVGGPWFLILIGAASLVLGLVSML